MPSPTQCPPGEPAHGDERLPLARRTLLGAAWAVPAISIASAAPAFASSGPTGADWSLTTWWEPNDAETIVVYSLLSPPADVRADAAYELHGKSVHDGGWRRYLIGAGFYGNPLHTHVMRRSWFPSQYSHLRGRAKLGDGTEIFSPEVAVVL